VLLERKRADEAVRWAGAYQQYYRKQQTMHSLKQAG